MLGTDIYRLDWDKLVSLRVDQSFLYQNSTVESAHIGIVFSGDLYVGTDMVVLCVGEPVVEAVKKLAVNLPEIERVAKSRDHHVMQEQFSSLEETQLSSQQFQFKDSSQLIRCCCFSCDRQTLNILFC